MRNGLGKAAFLAGAGALFAAAPAAALAQDANVRTMHGSVDSAAATFDLAIAPGSITTIDAISTSDLDPVMTVTDAVTGEVLAQDDDGGEAVNARVRIRGGESGRNVTVSVDGFDAAWVEEGESYGGSFDLRIATSAFVPGRTLAYGAREEGVIAFQEPVTYSFVGVAGETVEIALLAASEDSGLDPFLQLIGPDGDIVAENDDGNGINSYIRHTFGESGTYSIAAMGYGDSEGDFVLRVREGRQAVAAQAPLQVIGIGDTAAGELGTAWDAGSLLPPYIDYRFTPEAIAAIRAGEGAVTIAMNAAEAGDPDFGGAIDPLVQIGLDTPLGFAVIQEDDDGGGELNALLPIDLGPLAGDAAMLDMLRIRVSPVGNGGAYTLSVQPGIIAPNPAVPVMLDAEVALPAG